MTSPNIAEIVDGLTDAQWDETDWHVLAQDVANHWQHPEERAVAYQAAAVAIKICRAHLSTPIQDNPIHDQE